MKRTKLIPIAAVCSLLVLSGCSAEDNLVEGGDPPEVTCERFHDTIEKFSDIDPSTMGFGDILAHVSEGFSEIEVIADQAQDDELAQSIDTMSKTLNSTIAASGGDIDAVRAELDESLQEPEVQNATTYIEETCGTEMPL
ncbi:hypothetical protein [Enteractinococcus coprophilus]|uniref:Lipoprotein n=1 Tax=Enteractinococcus coprophilus TaxID=1027633 RepID=A0A543AP20_9MICC|nr:hypothetical protein [Enteractinococcus coprophilus]TQL74324.1 hypothetical protein FB556_0786 [Enteractinococcus coprophilus]